MIPDRALYFPSVEEIRSKLREVAAKGQGQIEETASQGEPTPVIVDMSQVVEIDFSAAAVILKGKIDLRQKSSHLPFESKEFLSEESKNLKIRAEMTER